MNSSRELKLTKEFSEGKRIFRLPLGLIKILNYEYWPFYLIFFPAIIYYLFLSIKSRSLTYFTATNPGIELGGFFGESKSEILKSIPHKYLPVSCYVDEKSSFTSIKKQMNLNNLNYPVICKPDKGERGFLVEKIDNDQELKKYLQLYTGKLIIQEFVSYEIELGILYYRYPDGSGSGISSVVTKEFLSVTGDGKSTIAELMNRSSRARFQIKKMKIIKGAALDEVLDEGQKLLLEPIGNHCRGTKFINGAHLINSKLVQQFDLIAQSMNEFYYGRFDLKVRSMEDLYTGEGIKIMEVNGTTSEPAHIYSSELNLLKVWKIILHHTGLTYKIAMQNNKRGIAFTPLWLVYKTVSNHFKQKA